LHSEDFDRRFTTPHVTDAIINLQVLYLLSEVNACKVFELQKIAAKAKLLNCGDHKEKSDILETKFVTLYLSLFRSVDVDSDHSEPLDEDPRY
jgi:hypothetical protein